MLWVNVAGKAQGQHFARGGPISLSWELLYHYYYYYYDIRPHLVIWFDGAKPPNKTHYLRIREEVSTDLHCSIRPMFWVAWDPEQRKEGCIVLKRIQFLHNLFCGCDAANWAYAAIINTIMTRNTTVQLSKHNHCLRLIWYVCHLNI